MFTFADLKNVSTLGFYGYIADDNHVIQDYLTKECLIIDVRTPMEYHEGHAPDSELVQMHEIPMQVERFKQLNKPIVLVCRTGSRAEAVKNYLLRFGIDVVNAGPWQAVL